MIPLIPLIPLILLILPTRTPPAVPAGPVAWCTTRSPRPGMLLPAGPTEVVEGVHRSDAAGADRPTTGALVTRADRPPVTVGIPEHPEWHVCAETIYQALYVYPKGSLRSEVKKALRTGRTTRKPRDGAVRIPRDPDRVSIAERPAEIEDRAVPGDWEGDLICGAYNKSAIGTLVDRKTRYVMLLHLPGAHDALSVRDAMIDRFTGMPAQMGLSVTWDQGSEMSLHREISVAADLDVYFCDPHSPWQRGTNENTNGLLRQYFPKSTDLSVHGLDRLREVEMLMNNRPRKALDWATPAEAMWAELDGILGQA